MYAIVPALAGLLLLLCEGCAYVVHKPVNYHLYPGNGGSPAQRQQVKADNEKADECETGVRYYLSSPYLLIYTDGKGNIKWTIYNLPDQTKLMVATPRQLFAKTTATFSFNNGILTTSKSVTDSTAAMKAVIGAVEKALPLLMGALFQKDSREIAAPRLYKIVIKDNELRLIGDQSAESISVTLKSGN